MPHHETNQPAYLLVTHQGRPVPQVAKRFLSDTSGAVTVDWVVLTAAVVALGVAVLSSISGGTTTLASAVSDEIGAMPVGEASGGATGGASTSTPLNGVTDCVEDTCTTYDFDTGETTRSPNESGSNRWTEFAGGEVTYSVTY